MADLAALTVAIEKGDRAAAAVLTQAAIEEEVDAQEILDAMTVAMDEIGRRFAAGDGIYIPEMLISANAMKQGSALLDPVLARSDVKPEHTAIIGTVRGDMHDIGKDLVAMMWRGAGIEVVDLGVNVSADEFVSAARERSADVVGISALLTTTMMEMKEIVSAFVAVDLPTPPIVVGGAPVDPEFAAEIGADRYAKDAATAVSVARDLLAGRAAKPS